MTAPIPPYALAAALRARLHRRQRLAVRLDGYRESAVLVPILVEEEVPPRLVFIERLARMRAHAGQVAFPGGARDPGDADLVATALREADEELAIPAQSVDVLGVLDDVPTPTGYVITPVVGLVRGPVALVPSPDEVAALFFAEVDLLRDPARYRSTGEREFLGIRYAMHEYHWERWRIWGATARMVTQLFELLDGGGPHGDEEAR